MCHRLLGPTICSSAVSVKMRHKVWFRWFGYGMLLAWKSPIDMARVDIEKKGLFEFLWLETRHVQSQWRIHGSLAWCAKCTFDWKSLTLMDPTELPGWLGHVRTVPANQTKVQNSQLDDTGLWCGMGYDGILPQKGRPDGAQNPIVRLDSNFVHVWWLTQESVTQRRNSRSRRSDTPGSDAL